MRSAQGKGYRIELSVLINDPFDGMIRLLNDVQRFGLSIVETVMREAGGGHLVTLLLASDRAVDAEALGARLGRHPCVVRVTTREGSQDLRHAA